MGLRTSRAKAAAVAAVTGVAAVLTVGLTPCPYNTTNDVLLKQNADKFVHRAVTTIMSSRAWTPHSAIFIVADEGDYTGNAVNGGWDSPAGC
jgi:hypothetical protein